MIRFENICKRYSGNDKLSVSQLNLNIDAGDFVVLLGESGCGKTTTLKMINRLIEPTSGRVWVDGQDISQTDPIALRRKIGYAFQGVGLFPHMSVEENISVVPRLLKWNPDKIRARVDQLLGVVKLKAERYKKRFPAELSGGQRQRVGFARALAVDPKVMLLDEPFGALDPVTRDSLQQELKRVHKKFGFTAVMVTHDVTEALTMADRIAVMKDGELLRFDTAREILTNPNHPYIERLMETPKRQAKFIEHFYGDA